MYHKLDSYPILKDETTLYVNEPWLVDKSLLEYETILNAEPDEVEEIPVGCAECLPFEEIEKLRRECLK
ncbi:hypothetical protein SAMN04487770_1314 [Butyrivibrio sp. ob235]|uniref:hypothetical protein n=1 Tax=Butyrivibrio sp. ob235 TaxID=1761780 RepID=UPI0008C4033F|nr:hypothetical protein [Butyrivibrio sp. ob235]SEM25788.1 hypothetical protein SAMN04487770_1314 [Butyrivibrio sp. ob235]